MSEEGMSREEMFGEEISEEEMTGKQMGQGRKGSAKKRRRRNVKEGMAQVELNIYPPKYREQRNNRGID
jgi:hypothetical protein